MGVVFLSSFSDLARSGEVRGCRGGMSYVDIADGDAWHDCGDVLRVREAIKSISSGR